MTRDQALMLLSNVRFRDWSFHIAGDFSSSAPTYLQARFLEIDADGSDSVELHEQHTRKWLLSAHMTPSELVQTAFKCVMTAIEHEVREQFTYRQARVFGPHFDVECLVDLARDRAPDVRAPVPGEYKP